MKDQNIVSEEEMYAFCFVQLLNLSNYERVQKSVWVYTGVGGSCYTLRYFELDQVHLACRTN